MNIGEWKVTKGMIGSIKKAKKYPSLENGQYEEYISTLSGQRVKTVRDYKVNGHEITVSKYEQDPEKYSVFIRCTSSK